MSEWRIEQPSTVGKTGVCFVETVSFVGAIVVIVGLVNIDRNQDKPKVNDKTRPKVESVRQDRVISLPDTIAFNATAYQK